LIYVLSPQWAFAPMLAAITGFILACPVVLYFGRGVKVNSLPCLLIETTEY